MTSWYLPRLKLLRMMSATPYKKLTLSLWFIGSPGHACVQTSNLDRAARNPERAHQRQGSGERLRTPQCTEIQMGQITNCPFIKYLGVRHLT